ncbi:MAG: 2,3-bisphosphoglycerate-independent phosphoglycerate mutase [Candidatus Doudnabacteria bacterium]|nr:2,3-bisphosphoglycerate-independent phosphoglycerate mutase [Candidatus Doudnabacteria bacterium]
MLNILMKHKIYKKVALVILDGFGVAPAGRGNAISRAKTPTLDYLVDNYPSLTLQASGPLVGLPWGEMGNSEVGHLNIGAGRIVGQDLPRISNSIQNGGFFSNAVLVEAVEHAKKFNSSLHLVGMVSPGGVHSLDEHLYALLSLAAELGQKKVYIHMFTDGRDTDPKIAPESIKKLDIKMAEVGVGKIATVSGRFYAMDRGGHWAQTMMAYGAMVDGLGETSRTPEECVAKNYQAQIFDEMIKPTVIVDDDNKAVGKISDNDALIFFNFRSDRALQLTEAFVSPQGMPPEFEHRLLQNLYFATITEYAPGLPVHVAFGPMSLKNNLAEVVSSSRLTQFHIAESEKYAHVTAFFNCGRTEKFPGEERIIVTSPTNNARNYSDHPEMSAEKLADELTLKISSTDINFFLANFANTDMVGHTGNLLAGIQAVEFVDKCLKKILDACMMADAALLVTADHGNIEQMINPRTGDIDKDHTTNPVPLLLAANEFKFSHPYSRGLMSLAERVPAGAVSDVAPTVLALFGLKKPQEMTGIDLTDEIDEVPAAH